VTSSDNAALESQGTDTDVEAVDVKRRKLKSVVWKEFTRVEINGVFPFHVCLYQLMTGGISMVYKLL
jgi:hypothetical protein